MQSLFLRYVRYLHSIAVSSETYKTQAERKKQLKIITSLRIRFDLFQLKGIFFLQKEIFFYIYNHTLNKQAETNIFK